MKQLLLFFSLTIFFINCTSTSSSQNISFYNGLELALSPNETVINIKHYPDIQSKYATYFENTDRSIPLNKYIKHPDYSLYVGIPYGVSISELTAEELFQNIELMEEKSEADVSSFKRYKTPSGLFVTEYARQYNDNSIFLLGITSKKETSDTFLNEEMWSEKLKPKI
ncbi:MAG: hypothetical protein AB8F94_29975 [Saprospiraceae bacterium]